MHRYKKVGGGFFDTINRISSNRDHMSHYRHIIGDSRVAFAVATLVGGVVAVLFITPSFAHAQTNPAFPKITIAVEKGGACMVGGASAVPVTNPEKFWNEGFASNQGFTSKTLTLPGAVSNVSLVQTDALGNHTWTVRPSIKGAVGVIDCQQGKICKLQNVKGDVYVGLRSNTANSNCKVGNGPTAPPTPTAVLGDVNGDGKVMASDTLMALKLAFGQSASGANIKNADADCSGGSITGTDFVIIQRATVDAAYQPLACGKSLPPYPKFTFTQVGSGSIEPTGKNTSDGLQLTMKAVPAQGWRFVKWSGGGCGTNVVCSVKLTNTSNVAFTATFAPKRTFSRGTTTAVVAGGAALLALAYVGMRSRAKVTV